MISIKQNMEKPLWEKQLYIQVDDLKYKMKLFFKHVGWNYLVAGTKVIKNKTLMEEFITQGHDLSIQ